MMDLEYLSIFEGYEVVEEIASRSDKSIYLVMDEKGKRRVLKVFQRAYKFPLYENLARLTHGNLANIYEVHFAEDCFYVLEEFIEGRTIQEILETDGTLDKGTVIDIVVQLCDVLFYLHNQAPPIIHRDINPANIMLTNDGVVKLLDFDIAREHKNDAPKDTEVMGTKPYAPPEQYGFSQSDHRADIYSLGVLITVMLTNTFVPARIQSARIKAVVKHCTAFDPKRRYEDARRLKNRIRLCVSPNRLLSSLRNMDMCIYVFPNARLRIRRLLLPIIILYAGIIAMSFVQPQPPDGYVPNVSLKLLTIVVNPQWMASDAQYDVFYVVVFALLYSMLAYAAFAVYDAVRFYYLRAWQRRRTKENTRIPFVIASKRYVQGILSVASTLLIICSIPFTQIWAEYDIQGAAGFVIIVWMLVSFLARGTRYPSGYNKAVRCYYRGDTSKAVKFAKESTGAKINPAKTWLGEILRMEK